MKKFSRDSEIVIIGAGMAGLAAAQRLHEAGIKVTILEARDRIGGRINTQIMHGVPIDLGASWIHGNIDNPLTELAKRAQAAIAFTDVHNILMYDENGNKVSAEKITKVDNEFLQALEQACQFAKKQPEDLSVSAAIKEVVTPEQINTALWQLRSTWYSSYTGAPLNNLSARSLDQEKLFEGGHHLVVDGYQKILQVLLNGYEIVFNSPVNKINYERNKVKLISTQGECVADAVIVTIPLSVLQQNKIDFYPQLPARKITAFKNLGMGLLNKIIMRFPKMFWPREYHLLSYCQKHYDFPPSFFNYNFYTQQPILAALPGGEIAEQLEQLSNKEIIDLVMQRLRKLFGNNIPDPAETVITRWRQEKFSGGSYSYIAVNGSGDDYHAMAEPVAERIFFAGEATDASFFATVHGAYISGVREAERILGHSSS